MKGSGHFFVELAGLWSVLVVIFFVSWSKLALGAGLAVIGAFFPNTKADRSNGSATVKLSRFSAAFRGSLRAGVVITGLAIVLGTLVHGYWNAADSSAIAAPKPAQQ